MQMKKLSYFQEGHVLRDSTGIEVMYLPGQIR